MRQTPKPASLELQLKSASFEEVDPEEQLLPDWLNGSEDFTEVIKSNADLILSQLSIAEKQDLLALLPKKQDGSDRE